MEKGKAFQNHSVFLYNTRSTVDSFGGKHRFIEKCKMLDIKAVWFRSHGTRGLYGDPVYNKDIMLSLSNVGILSAHWGWCQGKGNDHENVIEAIDEYKDFCDTYIADIEPGVNNSKWTKKSLDDFIIKIKRDDIFLAITTFGFVPWHNAELWSHITKKIDGWDIQAYWHHLPSKHMIEQGYAEKQDNPAHYCDVCIKEWKKVVGQNSLLHLSGQAYWGEGGFTKVEAEIQWKRFFAEYNGWNEICGFGYWHLFSLGQSLEMTEVLLNANVSQYWGVDFIPSPQLATIQYSNKEYSENVKRHQEFLLSLGYSEIYPDGYPGPMTSGVHRKVFGSYLQGDPRAVL